MLFNKSSLPVNKANLEQVLQDHYSVTITSKKVGVALSKPKKKTVKIKSTTKQKVELNQLFLELLKFHNDKNKLVFNDMLNSNSIFETYCLENKNNSITIKPNRENTIASKIKGLLSEL